MASLVVDALRCVTETDEAGSDDVYTVTFRGNTTKPFDSNLGVRGPGTLWTDFDSGNVELSDVTIATYRPDAVYVVMLVERDDDRDIDGDEVLGAWRAQTHAVWVASMLSLLGLSPGPATESQRAVAAQNIVNAMLGLASIYLNFPKGNDDVIDVPKRIRIAPGQNVLEEFSGDGGHYRIRFKVV
ncbi:MAG TPA: hypothetical protein VH482_07075 [Thermomicrobiales bacterium]|jgi:hypothetical protein